MVWLRDHCFSLDTFSTNFNVLAGILTEKSLVSCFFWFFM